MCLLCVGAQLKAATVISEKQAIQAVKNIVGNQMAEVTYGFGKAGITSADPSGDFLYGVNPSHFSPYFVMICHNRKYYVNAKTGFVDSILAESDRVVDPADRLTFDTIWRKYPMLPKRQMHQAYDCCWMLQYADGSWDPGVMMRYCKSASGLIEQVLVDYRPMPASRPKIKISKQQAVFIAKVLAGSYAWVDANSVVHTRSHYSMESVEDIHWAINQHGLPEAVCDVNFLYSSAPGVNASWLGSDYSHNYSDISRLTVTVNTIDGSIVQSREEQLQNPTAMMPGVRFVPISTLRYIAIGHKLTAKLGERAFTLNGKRIVLPAKVVAKVGTLYLHWQALKSLPGVKCSFDAKWKTLSISTTGAMKAK